MPKPKTGGYRRGEGEMPEPRRYDFTVEQQLVGKLGRRGFGALLDKLNRVTRKEK